MAIMLRFIVRERTKNMFDYRGLEDLTVNIWFVNLRLLIGSKIAMMYKTVLRPIKLMKKMLTLTTAPSLGCKKYFIGYLTY